jgi:hypothetical protein
MIINNLDVSGFVINPLEANAPLIVDANAVLPRPTTLELLQVVAWRSE